MTKAFEFNLEAVLEYRRMREEQARRDFLVVKRIHDQRREALDRLFVTRQEARGEMGTKGEGAVDVRELLRYQRYLNGLRYQIAAAQAELAKVEKELAARSELYEKARKERKIMDKLRERRHQEWTEDVRREEQRETDEIGSMTRARARRAEEA